MTLAPALLPLAISLGDPAGIGPEIIAKSWVARVPRALPPFFVVGDPEAIRAVWHGPLQIIATPDEAAGVFETSLPIICTDTREKTRPGVPDPAGAHTALEALELATGLTRSGAASALVTGPVSKAQLSGIGFTYPGQTEFVAERCGIARANAVMMLAGPGLRVVPVTIHIPLAHVFDLLTTDLIIARGRVVARELERDFGITAPRIAVAALNPHAGENGLMGDEEARIIQPAINALRADGINAFGPIVPDALFTPHMRKTYDVALCMYHDQALIPLKALHFEEGVNMTLGLPIIRTSPDHGTAFGIAGKGEADPRAMIAAITAAATAARNRARA